VQGSRPGLFPVVVAFWAGALIVAWMYAAPAGLPRALATATLPVATAVLCLVRRRDIRARTGRDAREWLYLAAFSLALAAFVLISEVGRPA
jgi:hypothetical protein